MFPASGSNVMLTMKWLVPFRSAEAELGKYYQHANVCVDNLLTFLEEKNAAGCSEQNLFPRFIV